MTAQSCFAPMPGRVLQLSSVDEALAWLKAVGVRSLQCDSRRVQPGDAFIAWPGLATDGRRYVLPALQAGACACLVEADGLLEGGWPAQWASGLPGDDGVPLVAALPGLKAATGMLASAFFNQPSRDVAVVAITGTNGKTSTAWWLAQALAAAGWPCGVVGTLGVGLPGPASRALAHMHPTGLTTPDPVTLQTSLRQWANAGVRACAIEASSIGLVEHRLHGTEVRVAVFTNFTQDHLDFHGSMASYWAAKRALFDWPGLQAAVVNVDDPQGRALAKDLEQRPGFVLWTVSLRPQDGDPVSGEVQAGHATSSHLCVRQRQVTPWGMRLVVAEGVHTAMLDVPLVGDYNAANLLGVLASMRALGWSLQDAATACGQIGAVPGRMEQVNRLLMPTTEGGSEQSGAPMPALPLVLVDYAHTPDALEKALQALQPLASARGGQLHAVVGCGGDRDATKRPLMAAAAESSARHLCLTSDNPRSENPLAILAQMQAGLAHPDLARVEPDRSRAIADQIALADVTDVVLIAGKGHETTQEVAGVKHPFSDQAHALAALQARMGQVRAEQAGR